ncbi:MAG: GGDEF domain-containing protein, partial [Clostridia bacterium]|nr:GGDEF domain-containing protein [Clostridia bacterium]
MQGVLDYITSNYIMIFELAGLMIMLGISVHVSARMKKLTVAVAVLLFAISVLYELEAWTSTFESLSMFRPMLTACVYSLYPIVLLLTLQMTAKLEMSNKLSLALIVPLLICIPVYFTTQWTHIVCYFSPENGYHGGPLNRLPYIVFALYCAVFIFLNFRYFKNSGREVRIIAGFIVVGPVVGVLFYLFRDYSGNYSGLFTSAIVLYFLLIYIHMARIDPLTQLLNRQSYYRVINSNSEHVSAAVSVDMNELKYINDTYGHDDGDKALTAVAGVLTAHRGNGGTVYRVGGDEFVILYRGVSEENVKNAIAEMREYMAKTDYTCAFGY